MKRPKKKVVLWFLVGALIVGMGMTLSMGMAIGSFTSFLFGNDGQAVSSPAIVATTAQRPGVPGSRGVLQDRSADKGPGAVIRGAIPPGFIAKKSTHKGTEAQLEDLWEEWSPEKPLAAPLIPRPGRP